MREGAQHSSVTAIEWFCKLEDAMLPKDADRRFIAPLLSLVMMAANPALSAFAQDDTPDARAITTEQKMTDDERFSLIISLIGPVLGVPRDTRIPDDVKNTS